MKRSTILGLVVAVMTLVACGGGGGKSGTVVPGSGTTTSLGTNLTKVSFSIALPAVVASKKRAVTPARTTSATVRKPLFVPPLVTSISIAVNGGTAQVFGCTPPTCSGTFLAPSGQTASILIQALNASGAVDAAATTSQFINANGVNTIDVTLLGVVNFVSVDPTPAGLPSNASGSSQLTVTGFDADYEAIPGTFFSPVTLSLNDTTGTVAFTGPTSFTTAGTTTIAYTMNASSVNVDNHLTIAAGGTTGPFAEAFEVGRTLYTYLPSGSVVGFNPGATSASRTVGAPGFVGVDMLACDGTNVYINDASAGYTYSLAPSGSGVSYIDVDEGASWLSAGTFENQAVLYVGNQVGGVYGLQGLAAAPGSPVAPVLNSIMWQAEANTELAAVLDAAGNVWTTKGTPNSGPIGGFNEYLGGAGPTPSTLSPSSVSIRSGATSGFYSLAIAIDTGTSPTTVYTGDGLSPSGPYEIFEFDTASATPTASSTDTIDGLVLTDSAGRVYTHHSADVWDVYARHALGTLLYSIPATSIAIDGAGYVFALQPTQITEYAPGGTTAVAYIPGNYATSTTPQFGTFCQAATASTATPPPESKARGSAP